MQLYMKQASKKCWRTSRFFKTFEELASFGWALGYPKSSFWVIVGPLPFSICTQPDVLLEIFIRDAIKWPRATGTGETPQRSGSRLSHRDRLPSTLWRTCCVSNSVDKLQSWAWVEKKWNRWGAKDNFRRPNISRWIITCNLNFGSDYSIQSLGA